MKKTILLFIASIGLILFSHITVNTSLAGYFFVNLPIAIKRGFPIPVFFWLGIFVYISLAACITKEPLKRWFKRGLVLGLCLHLILLLIKFKFQIAANPHIFSSIAYRVYSEVFILMAIPLLALCCLSLFRPIKWPAREKIKHFILQEKIFLFLIFIGALAIRIFFLSRIMGNPDYILTGSDGALYDRFAQSFLNGEKVTAPLVAGYWMFLALIYKIFGRSYFIVSLIQSVLLSLSCIFVYYIAKYIFNIKVARIAATLSAVSFLSIFSSVAIGHQAMDIFYVTLGMMLVAKYVYSRAKLTKKPLFLIFLGLVLGISIATREMNLFWFLIIVFWLIFFFSRRIGLKTAIRDSIIILLFVLVALTPFICRNIKNLGVCYPLTIKSGTQYNVLGYFKDENPDLIESGIDLFNANNLTEAFKDRPVFVVKSYFDSWFKKFKALYFSQGYGGFDMVFLYRLSDYYYALWFYVYVLTIIGIISAFKQQGLGVHSILFFFVVYRTFIHFLAIGSYRHRAPMEPFLILYFAFGVFIFMNFVVSTNLSIQKKDS